MSQSKTSNSLTFQGCFVATKRKKFLTLHQHCWGILFIAQIAMYRLHQIILSSVFNSASFRLRFSTFKVGTGIPVISATSL